MSTDYCIWRLQRRKFFVLFRNMCRYMFIYEPFRMMAEKAEIKMLNPSWRPSWHSEGRSTKWRGPAFKAERGSRKNSPCSVHRMANTIYTPYRHYPMSQWHSTKWVKSFQEGPQTGVLSQLAVIWEFCGGQSYCWVWVRTAQTPVATTGELPSSLVLGEVASP